MLEFTMEEMKKENILDRVENEVIKQGFEFIIIDFDIDNEILLKELVENIKNHYDLFVILKCNSPNRKEKIESYFSYGIHGIYFKEGSHIAGKAVDYATEIFTKGMVFYETSVKDRDLLDKLIEMKIIPVITSCDDDTLVYIKEKISKIKGLSGYLRYVPLIEQVKCRYHIGDKIKKKMMLELNNLRQKLMVKDVKDSFESSGL